MKEQNTPKARLEMKKLDEQENARPDAVKNASVNIGGRDIPLYYDVRAQIQIEEELEITYDELRENLNQLKGNPNTKMVISALRILGNRGLVHAGETGDLTDDWITDHIAIAYIRTYKVALLGAIMAGWFMETDNSWNEKQDEVLNEINKKKESTN